MYIEMQNVTMPEVRAAAKRFEKEVGKKVFIDTWYSTHSISSTFFHSLSRIECINFFNKNVVLKDIILDQCEDYACLIWEQLDKYKFLKEIDFTKKLVEKYAKAIGCFEATYDEDGFYKEVDEDTMFKNHDKDILEKIIREEFKEIGYTVSFRPYSFRP